jgi:hypothetical protein
MMKSTYSNLMQSRFFNPAFNSAIFDGPVRIYFAQFHENQALKVYFGLQNKYSEQLGLAKAASKDLGINLLVMLYPSSDSYEISFEGAPMDISTSELDGDIILGVRGPLEDHHIEKLLNAIMETLSTWTNSVSNRRTPELTIV